MMSTYNELFMEDIHVGQIFESSEHYELTEEKIVAFAKEFDDQPFHTDPVAAQKSLFKGLAGSGWMALSITMRLINSSFRLAGGNIGVGGEVAWPSPSRPGQKLRATTTIVKLEPSHSNPSRGRVTFRTETTDQGWRRGGDNAWHSADQGTILARFHVRSCPEKMIVHMSCALESDAASQK